MALPLNHNQDRLKLAIADLEAQFPSASRQVIEAAAKAHIEVYQETNVICMHDWLDKRVKR